MIRYQLVQLRFVLTVVVVLAGVALLGGSYGSGGGAVFAVVFFAVLMVLVIAYKRGQLAKTLAARGYRPGATVEAHADDEALCVIASTGSARHPWADIEHVRVVDGIVLFRMRAARLVVAVPVKAMPDGALQRIDDRASRRP